MNKLKEIVKLMLKGIIYSAVIFGIFSFEAIVHSKEKIQVTFINPDKPGNPFWDRVTSFMQAAANDLGIQLNVHYGNKNRFQVTKFAKESVQSSSKPDYLIYLYQRRQGIQILSAAEVAKVRSFIFNTDIPFDERSVVKEPREKFSYWIGHMFPDDVQAGYDLAIKLIEESRKNAKLGEDGNIQVVGVSGSRDSSAALDRNEGIKKALKNYTDVKLHQIVYANWDGRIAAQLVNGLLNRYPKTTVIWTASDGIALGVIEGLKKYGKIAGRDVFTGGIDWTTAGIKAIQEGGLVASLGGHFMEGGWILVLLYDYHHGIDFISSGKTIRSGMQIISKENIQFYLQWLGENNWEDLDFRRFSKVFNPKLKKYDFRLESLLKATQKSTDNQQ